MRSSLKLGLASVGALMLAFNAGAGMAAPMERPQPTPPVAYNQVTKTGFGLFFGFGSPSYYSAPYYPYNGYGPYYGYRPNPYYGYREYYTPPAAPYYYNAPPDAAWDPVAACASRFRSFDVASGTYVTYEGEVRLCPYLR